MKSPLIDRGFLRETMRRLRTPALTMLILATVFELLSQLVTDFKIQSEGTLFEFHPTLMAVPFVAAFFLTLSGFAYQNKRCDSDFYHALPYSRTTLSATVLAASCAWCGIIIVVSSVITSIIPFLYGKLSFLDFLLPMLSTCVASLFMASLTFFSAQLCGTKTATIFTVWTLMYAPYIVISTLYDLVASYSDLVPGVLYSSFALQNTNLMFGQFADISAWVWTVVFTVGLLIAGFAVANYRPSETAGNPSVHPVAQACMRTLLAFLCSLPAIGTIVSSVMDTDYYIDDDSLLTIAILNYAFVIAVYLLYELITTRTAKHLLKTLPWLGIVAALNVVCILGLLFAAIPFADSFTPSPKTVDSISLSTHIMQHDMAYEGDEKYWESLQNPEWQYDEEYDLVTEKPLFDNYSEYYYIGLETDEPIYYAWEAAYASANLQYVRVKDAACIEAACNAFVASKHDLDLGRNEYDSIFRKAYGSEWSVFEVNIDFHTGLLTHTRTVYLTETEYIALLNAINDVKPLPKFNFNFDAIH